MPRADPAGENAEIVRRVPVGAVSLSPTGPPGLGSNVLIHGPSA